MNVSVFVRAHACMWHAVLLPFKYLIVFLYLTHTKYIMTSVQYTLDKLVE